MNITIGGTRGRCPEPLSELVKGESRHSVRWENLIELGVFSIFEDVQFMEDFTSFLLEGLWCHVVILTWGISNKVCPSLRRAIQAELGLICFQGSTLLALDP